MVNMVICPKCNNPVREGAKFCAKCGTSLVDHPAVKTKAPAGQYATRPVGTGHSTRPVAPAGQTGAKVTRRLAPDSLAAVSGGARPQGAIIAGRYRVTGLTFDDGKLFTYPVVEFSIPAEEKTLQCKNPACGALHWKAAYADPDPRAFPPAVCDECNTPLQPGAYPELLVTEALDPTVLGHAPEVARLNLIHSSVRAPIDTAVELVCGQERTLVVEMRADPLPGKIERPQALKWAAGLAAGLDYLHARGISFNGQVSDTCFGLSDGRAVWSHFATCTVTPDAAVGDAARRADVRALVARLYQWLTGRDQVAPDPTFTPALNGFFSGAMNGGGFASGAEMAQALEKAFQDSRAGATVNYVTGRRTDVGRVRDLNEDSLLTIETARFSASNPRPAGIYVVADGMGGHSAGEVASGAIVSFLQNRCLAELNQAISNGANADWMAWLRATVESVNKHVFDLRRESGTDMGSTLVMAMIDGPHAYVAHVGDSRAYLVNNREIRRLTVDHSLVERLVATGQIRREEAQNHPQKNVIYRTVGDKPRVEVDANSFDLSVGDRLLLCSDGLCGLVTDDVIHRTVLGAPNPQAACEALVSAANAAGGDDNISVIIVEITRG